MCNAPKAPKAPPPPPPVVTEQDQAIGDSRERERKRQMAAAGVRSTMLTGADGVTESATTAKKQLLGQ